VTKRMLKDQWLHAIFKQIHDAVIVTDETGSIQWMNPAAEDLTGWTQEKAVEKRVSEVAPLIDPEKKIVTDQQVTRILEKGEAFKIGNHLKLVARNGAEIPIEEKGNPIKDDIGNVTGGIFIFRDLSETKRAEEQLLMLKKAFETMQLGITITDSEGLILYTNPAEAKMHGYRIEEMMHKDVRLLAPTHLWNPMKIEQLKEMRSWNRESVNVRKDGTTFPVQLFSDIVINEQGQVIGVVTSCQDITERKKLEAQLLHSQKMEAVGRLAGGVAHDFNNLLTAIIGYSDLLLNSPLRDALAFRSNHEIQEIKKAGEMAASLTHQLLAFSRRQILNPQELDLNEVIGKIKNLLSRLMGEDIEIVTELDPHLCPLKADPVQIQQILMNLMINAQDAMPHGGRITIKTRNFDGNDLNHDQKVEMGSGNFIVLEVTDTGVGMDTEIQSQVFEPFFTTKEAGKGTGLGLSTVYGIVKQSGGNIQLYTKIGKGTTFRIYLPCLKDAVPSSSYREKSLETFQGSETILVVDDDDLLRNYVHRVLQLSGYMVFTARDGEKALKLCREQEPAVDLLLTDIILPGMNGYQLFKELKQETPEMKVVYMSGWTDDKIIDDSFWDSDIVLLQKPFPFHTLMQKIRDVLNSE